MKAVRTELIEPEKELVNCLVMDWKTTGGVHDKMKRLFADTIEQYSIDFPKTCVYAKAGIGRTY